MPAIATCPICGFDGNHGFSPSDRLSGMMFYHDNHTWYQGIDNKIYTDRLLAFLAGANYLHESINTNWHKAMIAKIKGHPRIANKYFKLWKKEYGY
jgi:hypothetical protein